TGGRVFESRRGRCASFVRRVRRRRVMNAGIRRSSTQPFSSAMRRKVGLVALAVMAPPALAASSTASLVHSSCPVPAAAGEAIAWFTLSAQTRAHRLSLRRRTNKLGSVVCTRYSDFIAPRRSGGKEDAMSILSGVLKDTLQRFVDWIGASGPKLLAGV